MAHIIPWRLSYSLDRFDERAVKNLARFKNHVLKRSSCIYKIIIAYVRCILFNLISVTLIEKKKICKTIFHVPRIHQKSWDPLCSVLLSHHFSLRKNRYISSIYCCQRSWKNHLPKGVMDDIGQGITSGIKSLGYRKSICFVSEFKSRTALKGS